MQEVDKIVIAGGKPSVIKKVQAEFDKEAAQQTQQEEISEEDEEPEQEDMFEELEAESVKKEKKKGRPSRIRPAI